jgi:hypothetical protein
MADTTENQNMEAPPAAPAAATHKGMSRRAMLRGAGPAIVTLYSGAALAKSSNLIGTAPTIGPEGDKYRCLDTASVYPTSNPNQYDLGQTPMAHVTQIRTTRQYYPTTNNYSPSGPQVSPKQMCSTGGKFVRKDGWHKYTKVNVSRGVIVSATAISSFSNNVTYTDI